MTERQTDKRVLDHIQALVDEEHALYARTDLDGNDQHRLEAIRVELDQSWDLLRQRRALREFGENPDNAHIRPARVVEDYEQ